MTTAPPKRRRTKHLGRPVVCVERPDQPPFGDYLAAHKAVVVSKSAMLRSLNHGTPCYDRGHFAFVPPIRFYVPKNFDAEAVLARAYAKLEKPRKVPPTHAARANYFCDLLLNKATYLRDKSKAANPFVSLKVEYLQEDGVLDEVRQALITEGVVELDPKYVVGEHSMGYRLMPEFRQPVPPRRVEYTAGRIYKLFRASRERDRRHFSDVHRYLESWLKKVTIDLDGATRAILMTPRFAEKSRADLLLRNCAMIDAKDIYTSVCRYGRLHGSAGALAREPREYIRIAGQPLVGIDVRNSQPLLLGLVIAEQRLYGSSAIDPEQFVQGGDLYAPARRYVNLPAGWRDALLPDELKYLELCEAGQLYEHVQSLTKHRDSGNDGREWVKARMQTYLYGEDERGDVRSTSPIRIPFTNEFPHVADVLRAAKRTKHSALPVLLQNIEAEIVLNRVCRRLMTDHRNVPPVPVHDSIYTTPEHESLVRKLMTEAFEDVGLKVKLK
ncbi:MAG TPA: hypothetical protein VGR35_01070 [Tepidisphaeraceae bacterium]|nr:hypothetical protein [Tepidisphaeraceae bacterium]